MIKTNRMIRLCVVLVVAMGLTVLPGCGDDDPTTPQKKPVDPSLITMQLTATISQVSDSDGLLGGAIVVGDTITGTYTYDIDTVDSNTLETVGDYLHDSAPNGIFLESKGYEFATDPTDVDFVLELVNDHGGPGDNYLLRSQNNAPASLNVSVDNISWQLDDASGAALDSVGLTTEPPVLADWTSIFGLTIQGSHTNVLKKDFSIRGHVLEVSRVD